MVPVAVVGAAGVAAEAVALLNRRMNISSVSVIVVGGVGVGVEDGAACGRVVGPVDVEDGVGAVGGEDGVGVVDGGVVEADAVMYVMLERW